MIKNLDSKFKILLSLIVLTTFIYSFALSLKRYNNYEYGKFDLGNMSQMVWNSSRGHFMEVTDQFGTNMPRWGMSHVDPILLIFVPVYWIYAHPMIMVFIQQIIVLSAAFAIYSLTKLKTSSSILAFLAGVTYTFYPAVGYTLIWTTYHGISFVAPILIWLIYYLEKNNFLMGEKMSGKKTVIFWSALIFLLLGKEEIGLMTALAALFVYKKNKRLALQTFVVSMIWFVFAFFILIPAYAPLRQASVSAFIQEVGINNAKPTEVQGDNFFLVRYSHLGNSYSEMLKNIALNPRLIFEPFAENLKVLNDLVGPLGYVSILNPFWLISLPDLVIAVLSNEQIFGIDNHRVAFIISGLFVSYIYLLVWLKKKDKMVVAFAFAGACLLSTVYFSYKTQNPLFISATSFINEKIIKKVFAQQENKFDENQKMVLGYTRKGSVPRNDKMCLDYVVKNIYKKNPNIYSGPDYLGAHASNRYVNALFPARISDADFIAADLFDEKAIDRVGADSWFTNKLALEKITRNSNYNHLFSCGMLNVFEKKEGSMILRFEPAFSGETFSLQFFDVITSKLEAKVAPIEIPKQVKTGGSDSFKIALSKPKGGFGDAISYWKFENEDDKNLVYSFIDYLTAGNSELVNKTVKEGELDGQYLIGEINIFFPEYLKHGNYKVFYGFGDLVRATEVYIGDIKLNE